jgi:glutamate-5-semialdehyde dehydrogenase
MSDLQSEIENICRGARRASNVLLSTSTEERNHLLETIATCLEARKESIQEANRLDCEAGEKNGLTPALLDRLDLNDRRFTNMVQGLRDVIALADPVGEVIRTWTMYNGIEMQKVRTPIGVIGIIYESRPNVTIDAGGLCLKTGNVPVLRGGKEAFRTNQILIEAMQEAARECGLPPEVASFITTTEREAIPIMCQQDRFVDLMIPRGGHGLIKTVVENARMPVIKHYHGVCHVYVHEKADLDMAREIVVNAKCQRPGVCNALETLLVDASIAGDFLPKVAAELRDKGVQLLGDEQASAALGESLEAPENWEVEYLDLILAIRVVPGIDEVLDHLNLYGSHHTETIVTEDREVAETFLRKVDSSTVFWNASTRFADGGQFGFGAEIGISTDKIHARGPMALEELTIYKYVGRGQGQVRS